MFYGRVVRLNQRSAPCNTRSRSSGRILSPRRITSSGSKTLQVLLSGPVCVHADGQPHGSAIGKLDGVIGGGSAIGVVAKESRFRAASKRDSLIGNLPQNVPMTNREHLRSRRCPFNMLDVDLIHCWRIGKGVFTAWLLPLGFAAKLVVVRRSTVMSLPRSLATDATMSVLTWVFLIGVPVPILAWDAAHRLILDRMVEGERADPFSWIAVLLVGGVLAGALDFGVVRITFRQHLGHLSFWILVVVNLLCLIVAGYWTTMYILRHPPVA
jgi:hypothetical protein